jgi:hypothetical protein
VTGRSQILSVLSRPDLARASVASLGDLTQVRVLLAVYAVALAEARSWDDPGVGGFIVSLETLQARAREQERALEEDARAAALLARKPPRARAAAGSALGS